MNLKAHAAVIHELQTRAVKERSEMVGFLRELAAISSPTASKRAVDQAGDLVDQFVPGLFRRERIGSTQYGDCRFYSHEPAGIAPVALMGHLDTVVPDGFDTIEERDGSLIGPGVADMKGGITVMVWALRLLEGAGLLPEVAVRCLVNTEEEINSPWSRSLVPRFKGCRAGFVFEMGGRERDIVTTRIGISVFRLVVHGIASHAGTGREPKASAILELARLIRCLEAMNAPDFKLNVGTISGGKAYNYVPDHAEAVLAIRIWDESREAEFLECCKPLLNELLIPGCRAELKKVTSRPPLKPGAASMELFEMCREIGSIMGVEIPEEKRPGGSDASFIAAQGLPVLDGLGPVGDFDFSWDEYIEIDSLAERAALTAAAIWCLCSQDRG